MDDWIIRFRVGVVVAATVLIAAILLVMFGEIRTPLPWRGTKDYTIHILFARAPGVSRNTPVRKSGILIGRVSSISFEDDGRVRVSANIEGRYSLLHRDRPRVRGTILGDANIEFTPDMDAQIGPGKFANDDVIEGVTTPDLLQIVTDIAPRLQEAVVNVERAFSEIDRVAARVNTFFNSNEGKFTALVDNADLAFTSFTQTVKRVDGMLGPDTQGHFREALKSIPELLTETRSTMQSIQKVTETAQANLSHLENFTRPLGERGPALVDNIDASVARLNHLMGQLDNFAQTVNDNQGTLGRLLNDRELYNNVNRAAVNIEELTRQLRPVLKDARIFAHKIARDPGRLGVRGVLRKQSGIK